MECSSQSCVLLRLDSIAANGHVIKLEFNTTKELVSRIPSADYRTELKELMSNDQYPVWCGSDDQTNDKLCGEIFDEVFHDVAETSSKFDQCFTIFFSNKHSYILHLTFSILI